MISTEEIRNGLRANRELRRNQLTGGQDGASIQPEQGASTTPGGPIGGIDSSARLPNAELIRQRQATRRLSSDNSGIHDGITPVAGKRRGRIVREDDVPTRVVPVVSETPPIKGSRRKSINTLEPPQKGQPALVKAIPWLGSSKTLSKQEATELYEPLIVALSDWADHADEFIWWRAKDENKVPIWSDLDADEKTVIARVLIKRGERNAATAGIVRGIIDSNEYVSLAAILGPRTFRTIDTLTAKARAQKARELAERRAKKEGVPVQTLRSGGGLRT